MDFPKKGQVLKIYIGESDKHEGMPLYEWFVLRAKEIGLAGATVIRGNMGYGANSRIHTSRILRLSMDLPIVIEIVDTKDEIDKFLPEIEKVVKEGLVTVEDVEVHIYRNALEGESK